MAQMIDTKYVSVVGPFLSVVGPYFLGNQQSLVLNQSWPSLIGGHRSSRLRTDEKDRQFCVYHFSYHAGVEWKSFKD